ncbi:ring-cleaving dioxygenase [Paludisphaera borealis]|uniref:Ring-cleaving dioxygenase MhqO n=1 Tax=Paludisphaera borealis TaxID=1387353 RepID=A0A1U7CNK5_9BACT|nr:ring-cleaving dioxygenase [Paludisphaera borealis]APW60520.1 Putative ring-cleaving dioxygenase MhqO [Paludisphaera borealis]
MSSTLPGLHHVTAITADAQKNVDFYCGVLGLRLVKLTVNFDDPTSYHLYYGDQLGTPGTIMTFFAWHGAQRGRVGTPQVTATSFAVLSAALPFWAERLARRGVATRPIVSRFGEDVLGFDDPDGMALEIVATSAPGDQAPATGAIQAESVLRGFHGVTISEEGYEATAKLLTEVMGFRADGHEGNRFRYRSESGGFASIVDLTCMPDARHGGLGAGIVHHVAFRTPGDEQQKEWRSKIARLGYNVSPVMDRNYFHSIYFREPGGVLFEIATDPPGFAVDEAADRLGTRLMLPAELEPRRPELEQILPTLRVPNSN